IFFSSRRRHTRCLSDWSSDVCSSDLIVADCESEPTPGQIRRDADLALAVVARFAIALAVAELHVEHVDLVITGEDVTLAVDKKRSEERRVGKGCRWMEWA